MDLVTLEIEQMIVHDLPLRLVKQKTGGPVLSTAPSELDRDIRSYFNNRLTQTLERNAAAG